MNLFKYCFAALAACVTLVSCENIIGGNEELIVTPEEGALLEQTVEATAITAEAVTFTTTGAWSSEVTPSATKASQPMWLAVTPDHGDKADTYTVEFVLEANEDTESRTADVTITCGNKSFTLTITQLGAEAPTDDPTDDPTDGPTDDPSDDPSQGDPTGVEYEKYVKSIKYDFVCYDGDEDHEELLFSYDEYNRVVSVKMTEKRRREEDVLTYISTYNFDYSVAGQIHMTRVTEGDDDEEDDEYDTIIKLDDQGRVISYKGYSSEEIGIRYAEDGHIMGYYAVNGHADDRVDFIYTDGLWSGMGYYDDGVLESEDMEHFQYMYVNRYPNDKINIDLNMFIMNNELNNFGYDPLVATLINLRLCGKFSDCLMEIGGSWMESNDVYEINNLEWLKTPNNRIPFSYTTVRVDSPETGDPVVWTFDDKGCPLTATVTAHYQEYKAEYELIVGTTVTDEYTGFDPETGEEVTYKIYDYTWSDTTYTPTSNKWDCPSTFTVTYVE